MLNRTNRTQSANLNRLNLGTRTLANQANGNHGAQTLRTVHDEQVVFMRAGLRGYPAPWFKVPSIMGPKPRKAAMPAMSSSSLRSPWPSSGYEARVLGSFVAVAPPPVPSVVVRPRGQDADAVGRDDAPLDLDRSTLRLARLDLASDCVRRRMTAGRSARAALVSDAAP
jgi:hypothetical protein